MEVKGIIIEGASKVFMQYGIRSVTMDDLAKSLGMSKKTLYQYFKDKEEIVGEVLKGHLQLQMQQFDRIKREASNAIEELVMGSQLLKQMMMGINPTLLFDLQKYHPKSYSLFSEFKKEFFFGSLKESLERGIREGYFRKELKPDILATMRMELIEASFRPGTFDYSVYSFHEVQIYLMDHFVHGILTPKGEELFEKAIMNLNLSNK